MEFTREILKDQLHLCKIPKKAFDISFNISLVIPCVLELFKVDDMIKSFVKNL
jgi:hypothetical protein